MRGFTRECTKASIRVSEDGFNPISPATHVARTAGPSGGSHSAGATTIPAELTDFRKHFRGFRQRRATKREIPRAASNTPPLSLGMPPADEEARAFHRKPGVAASSPGRPRFRRAQSEWRGLACAGALAQGDEPVRDHLRPALDRSLGPFHDDGDRLTPGGEAEVRPHVVRAQVARIGMDPSPERRETSPHDTYACTDAETVAVAALQPDLQPMMTV